MITIMSKAVRLDVFLTFVTCSKSGHHHLFTELHDIQALKNQFRSSFRELRTLPPGLGDRRVKYLNCPTTYRFLVHKVSQKGHNLLLKYLWDLFPCHSVICFHRKHMYRVKVWVDQNTYAPLRSKFARHSHPALSAALAALVPVEDSLTSLSPLKL